MSDSNNAVSIPPAILTASVDARVKWFDAQIVPHATLTDARDRVLDTLRGPKDKNLIFVIGPAGCGKSTLCHIVRAARAAEFKLEAIDPSHILQVLLTAVAPDNTPHRVSNFDFSDFDARFLLALDEPLLNHKIAIEPPPNLVSAPPLLLPGESKASAAVVRRLAERAAQNRAVRDVHIDEAQDIGANTTTGSQLAQMNSIKARATLMRVKLVLYGTYDLIILLDQEPQVDRRSRYVHLRRYEAERSEDLNEFKKIVRSFQAIMPIAPQPDLEGKWEYLYMQSIGCVGILKTLLSGALRSALEERKPTTLTMKHLQRHALTPRQCNNMLLIARAGEDELADFEDSPAAQAQLRKAVGLPDNRQALNEGASETTPPARGARRPGERAPQRDRVGRGARVKEECNVY